MNIIKHQLLSPKLNGCSIEEKRAELKAYFNHTWHTYEALFSLINHDDAYYERPERLRHPLIFYFGHTATFYINKLILGKFIKTRINTKLEAICAVGVDEMSWDDLDPTHYEWPSVEDVRLYRNQVASLINDMIDNMELVLPITQDSLAWIILMGCEHEKIHLETSSVIMRMLPLSSLTAAPQWVTCEHDSGIIANSLENVSGTKITLGKPLSDDTFGWDNEYGSQIQDLEAFKASKYLVSNHEFLQFMEAGGYENKSYWSEEGQQWLSFSQARMPRFWLLKEGQYYQRNLLNEIPLPLSWPAEVNYLEAKAFCQWKSELTGKHIHLPTEAQWHALRANKSLDTLLSSANTNLAQYASSCPVDMHAQGDFFDVLGNVWQWSESIIDGFDGFKVHPLYDDFSTPTFDGKHNIILGSSWISTGNELLASSRYAFRRHFFQHAGFRYVENSQAEPPVQVLNPYETDLAISQYLECHYGKAPLFFVHKPYCLALSDFVKELVQDLAINTTKLLDLGCKVGRVSFELSRVFKYIDAVDFSAAPIKHAVQLQKGNEVRYIQKQEGELVTFNQITPLPEELLRNKNLVFTQGDASNLKAKYSQYDVILAQNVLEENYAPRLFLQNIHHRLNHQGLLILVTDYQDSENVESAQRISGKKINGENITGFEVLSELLEGQYKLVEQKSLPQVMSQDERHFSLVQYHVTVWQKS